MNEKINKFVHSKSFVVFLIVLLMSLVTIAGTYAWFTWSSTNNTSLTMSIGKLADVIFTNGPDINTTNLAPVFNYTDGEKTTFSIVNRDSGTTNIVHSVKLNVSSLPTPLRSTSFKYVLLNGTTEVATGDFSPYTDGSVITLVSNETLASGTTEYTFYLYIDANLENDLSMMNQQFTGTIEVSASENLSLVTLTNLGLSVDTTHTPDFSTVSGNNGVKYNSDNTTVSNQGDGTNGIYVSEDDLGKSYYFRGAVENNYVSFANFYWRIIRINGDGTIRMIYAGTSPHENGYDDSSTADTSIGTSAYNSSYDDNAYVGYMYGTPSSSTYAETHANTNNSTIKEYIDNWYQNNLSSYSQYIADTIYCNDRSITPVDSFAGMALTSSGFGTEDTAYSDLTRNFIDYTPSLKCTNKNDCFTVNSNIGNGSLTYPVGLLTLDEAAMAGGVTYNIPNNYYITNTDYYLYNGDNYWTITPFAFAGGHAGVGGVYGDGDLSNDGVNDGGGVRPVVSLKSNAISGGSGTTSDPFVVG